MNQEKELKPNKLKFAFFGTPELCIEILDELFENGYVPSVIVTNKDKPKGRKMILTQSPVKFWAIEHKIPVLEPDKLDEGFFSNLKNYELDLSIVVAYGKIIPENIINYPKLGTINIHYSLLPKYRGATPVESAILSGDEETGVSIQQMRFALDSGPVLVEEKINIGPSETALDLRSRLNKIAQKILVGILPNIANKNVEPKEQDKASATFCKKIKKEDGEILENDSDETKWRKYRAYFGWPGIYFFENGKRIKITKARYENEKFIIEKIIPEGKKEVDYK